MAGKPLIPTFSPSDGEKEKKRRKYGKPGKGTRYRTIVLYLEDREISAQ